MCNNPGDAARPHGMLDLGPVEVIRSKQSLKGASGAFLTNSETGYPEIVVYSDDWWQIKP